MHNYEMDPMRTVGATERRRDAGRMDGRSETNVPLNNSIINLHKAYALKIWVTFTSALELLQSWQRNLEQTEELIVKRICPESLM